MKKINCPWRGRHNIKPEELLELNAGRFSNVNLTYPMPLCGSVFGFSTSNADKLLLFRQTNPKGTLVALMPPASVLEQWNEECRLSYEQLVLEADVVLAYERPVCRGCRHKRKLFQAKQAIDVIAYLI